jgi:hypothetical protein
MATRDELLRTAFILIVARHVCLHRRKPQLHFEDRDARVLGGNKLLVNNVDGVSTLQS